MKVVQVPGGLDAPDGADYIRLDRLPSGWVQYTGNVASSKSVAIIAESFADADAAMEQGIEWAKRKNSPRLYVIDSVRERSAGLPALPREQLTDTELLSAYQRTIGSPENTVAEWLLDEIERRGLDV